MKSIKLSKWAKENGYSYQGAYELFARGQLPEAYRLASGYIMVPVKENQPEIIHPATVIYCRVSTPKQKDDLDRQVESATAFCIANGWVVNKIYKEITSGLNDNRPQLNKLLDNKSITKVVVTNKDRLTRFGFNYLKRHLESNNCQLIVMNEAQTSQNDLMDDFVSIITSMAARIYGLRRHKSRIDKIIKDLSND
jgi:predicted site-specific integrase-resolvase